MLLLLMTDMCWLTKHLCLSVTSLTSWHSMLLYIGYRMTSPMECWCHCILESAVDIVNICWMWLLTNMDSVLFVFLYRMVSFNFIDYIGKCCQYTIHHYHSTSDGIWLSYLKMFLTILNVNHLQHYAYFILTTFNKCCQHV